MRQRTVNYCAFQDFDFCDDSLSEIAEFFEAGKARYSLYKASQVLQLITDNDDREMLETFIRNYGDAMIDLEES